MSAFEELENREMRTETYRCTHTDTGQTQTAQVAKMNGSPDLGDPLHASKASDADAQNIGPLLRVPREAVQDDSRNEHNGESERNHSDKKTDRAASTAESAIRR